MNPENSYVPVLIVVITVELEGEAQFFRNGLIAHQILAGGQLKTAGLNAGSESCSTVQRVPSPPPDAGNHLLRCVGSREKSSASDFLMPFWDKSFLGPAPTNPPPALGIEK